MASRTRPYRSRHYKAGLSTARHGVKPNPFDLVLPSYQRGYARGQTERFAVQLVIFAGSLFIGGVIWTTLPF